MSVPDWLDDAAAFATCATLASAGTTLVGAGVSTLWAGGGGLVPLGAGMLSLLAAGVACQPMDIDGPDPIPGIDGCQELNTGEFGHLQVKLRGQDWIDIAPFGEWSKADTCNRIESIEIYFAEAARPQVWRTRVVWLTTGNTGDYLSQGEYDFQSYNDAAIAQFRIRPLEGQSCKFGTDTPQPLPPEFYEPRQYTNPTTNCIYNIQALDMVQAYKGGPADIVFSIEAANQNRDTGEQVGGCNFNKIVYYRPTGGPPQGPGGGGGGGGGWTFPFPDDDDWKRIIKDTLPFFAYEALQALVEAATDVIPESKYSVIAPCEYQENGDPAEWSMSIPEETFRWGVINRLDALAEMFTPQLAFKQPTCAATSPKIGEYRTISWTSDDPSPQGERPLRKRFKYRSSSGLDLGGVVDHWRAFVWQAGPVMVEHSGSQLGKPQVWAASIDEGKRVIRHAAAEAGIAVDQVGQWRVSGTDDPRYGMPGTMRVNTKGGYYWITSRDGASERPIVVAT